MPFLVPLAAPLFTVEGLMVAGVATMAVGTAMQMAGARQSAKAEATLYRYNAAVAEREAAEKERASREEQLIQREQAREVLKRQRVLYAKGKIMPSGSYLEVQLKSAKTMAADIAELTHTRTMEAGRLRSRATIERFKSKAALQTGRLGVATSLVGGVSDISRLGMSYYLNK